jgi:hypothetical protein
MRIKEFILCGLIAGEGLGVEELTTFLLRCVFETAKCSAFLIKLRQKFFCDYFLSISGIILCMNATIDSGLVKVVQEHINKLSIDVEKMACKSQEEISNLKMMLDSVKLLLQEYEGRFVRIENNINITADKMTQLTNNQKDLQQEQISTAVKIGKLTTNQEVLQQELSSTVEKVEQLQTSRTPAKHNVTEGQASSYGNILLILPMRHITFFLYNRNIINIAGILIFSLQQKYLTIIP